MIVVASPWLSAAKRPRGIWMGRVCLKQATSGSVPSFTPGLTNFGSFMRVSASLNSVPRIGSKIQIRPDPNATAHSPVASSKARSRTRSRREYGIFQLKTYRSSTGTTNRSAPNPIGTESPRTMSPPTSTTCTILRPVSPHRQRTVGSMLMQIGISSTGKGGDKVNLQLPPSEVSGYTTCIVRVARSSLSSPK